MYELISFQKYFVYFMVMKTNFFFFLNCVIFRQKYPATEEVGGKETLQSEKWSEEHAEQCAAVTAAKQKIKTLSVEKRSTLLAY